MPAQAPAGTPKLIALEKLELDPNNPRLPEELLGAGQGELLRHIYRTGNLEELAQSLVDNGYFPHEPLIVQDLGSDRYRVLEGNRRVASLKILLGDVGDEDLSFTALEDINKNLDELREVPCFVVTSEAPVHTYLGFRHISGLKEWSPSSKARYVFQEVQEVHRRGEDRPFYVVGRMIGSNSTGVRTSYISYAILFVARRDHSIDVKPVLDPDNRRFGVWQRLLSSKGVRSYIGFNGAREYDEVQAALGTLVPENIERVIGDMVPQPGMREAVIRDSRQASEYGEILENPKAAKVLAERGSIELAGKVLHAETLPQRLTDILETLRVYIGELAEPPVERSVLRPIIDAIANVVESMQKLSR